jgi:uncharacterized protein YraI
MPAGATVEYLGESKNNFLKVKFQGRNGWASADYLEAPRSSEGGDPTIVGTAMVTTALNLRSGPSTGHQVLRVMTAGEMVQISDTVQNGFRSILHQGLAGWASDRYLQQGGSEPVGDAGYAMVALNLRAAPSTSAEVLLVIPDGGMVFCGDQVSNGYRGVRFSGIQGWAWDASIDKRGAPASGQVRTTTYLNFRAEPSPSGKILAVLPPGTALPYEDVTKNGFRHSVYQGKGGWAYDEFLT